MLGHLKSLRARLNAAQSVIFLTEDGHSPARKYSYTPKLVILGLAAATVAVMVATAAVLSFSPLRKWIPGYGTDEIRQTAMLNSIQMSAIQDSLVAQQVYVDHLRQVLSGDIATGGADAAAQANPGDGSRLRGAPTQPIQSDEGQPSQDIFPGFMQTARRQGTGVLFPALSPVEGFLTQPFDESTQHYGVDFAVQQGTPVKSIAPGRVIFADWTHDGGYAIAVQHVGGYISVYMHNKLLAKEVGSSVGNRETIAMSGNTGEVSSGPHLHFELWQDGRRLNPTAFFATWQDNEK